MTKEFIFAEEVKSVIVDMTISDELPMDISNLDIQEVFNKAKENLKTNKGYIRECQIDKLEKFVSYDDYYELVQMHHILENLNSDSDNEIVDYIDGIQILEIYETTFTVKELWAEIE